MATSLQRLGLALLLAVSAGAGAACSRGEDGRSGAAGAAADGEEGGVAAAGGDEAADLPPQIAAEHPVPAPGAPPALRPGETVSFLDGTEAEPDGPRPALHLAVADLAASAAFYGDVLGFTVESAVPPEPPYRRVELARDGVRLVLRRRDELAAELPPPAAGGAEDPPAEDAGAAADAEEAGVEEAAAAPAHPPSPAALLLPAPDLDALLRRVEEAGSGTARLGEAADGSRRLAVRDPDGHVLVFAEPLPPEPEPD